MLLTISPSSWKCVLQGYVCSRVSRPTAQCLAHHFSASHTFKSLRTAQGLRPCMNTTVRAVISTDRLAHYLIRGAVPLLEPEHIKTSAMSTLRRSTPIPWAAYLQNRCVLSLDDRQDHYLYYLSPFLAEQPLDPTATSSPAVCLQASLADAHMGISECHRNVGR